MKTWWTSVAWPWLKSNWWVLLLLPLMLLVGVGLFVSKLLKPPSVATIDPTEMADERARVEHETRVRALEQENERLKQELHETEARFASMREAYEAQLQSEVEDLRNNPDRLRELMKQVGSR